MPIVNEPPRPMTTTTPLPGQHAARHAENSDGKMAIRHEEEKSERKKQDDRRGELTLPEDVYDQTTLGVRALIDFLKKFLQSLDHQSQAATSSVAPEDKKDIQSQPETAIDHPSNPVAAAAAQAYGRTAQQRTEYRTTAPAAPSLLQSAEIRQIHELLTKLNQLDQKNIAGLKLYKADSFVQSLVNAADLALAELSSP